MSMASLELRTRHPRSVVRHVPPRAVMDACELEIVHPAKALPDGGVDVLRAWWSYTEAQPGLETCLDAARRPLSAPRFVTVRWAGQRPDAPSRCGRPADRWNRLCAEFLVKGATHALIEDLAEGVLVAVGRRAEGLADEEFLPAALWRDGDTVIDVGEGKILQRDGPRPRQRRALYRGVWIRRVRSDGHDALASDEVLCRQWLQREVAAGPPHGSKDSYWRMATERYPRLSLNGFKRAWGTAVADAPLWRRPGRRTG